MKQDSCSTVNPSRNSKVCRFTNLSHKSAKFCVEAACKSVRLQLTGRREPWRRQMTMLADQQPRGQPRHHPGPIRTA